MPAMHSFTDMTTNTPGYNDEHRAIQIALELSMMGIGTEDEPTVSQGTALSQTNMDVADAVRKKSANMTECVPVPSSEHVAEIVGRQGCKIKALRAKTNTYIKTPVRGEEPVFVVTGRKEDVGAAKREILSAAEHFSQIRASRRNSSVSSMSSAGSSLTPGPPSPNAPGQVTIQVRVPYRVVGLVVGPKGATIKRIQQQTQTYIVTPSRDKEPVFEVTGLTENVEKARQEIESHIAIRTGGIIDNQNEDDFRNNGIDSGFHELNGDFSNSMNKPNSMSALGCNNVYNALNGGLPAESNIFSFPPVHRSTKISEFSNFSGGFSSLSSYGLYDDEGIGSSPPTDPLGAPPTWPDFHEKNKNFFVPNIFGSPTSSNESSSSQSTNGMNCNGHRLSPTLTDATTSPLNGSMNGSLNGSGGSACSSPSPPSNLTARRTAVDSVVSSGSSLFSMSNLSQIPKGDFDSSSIICTSGMTSTIDVTQVMNGGVSCPMQVPTLNGQPRRQCFMCSESDIVAALVPCGHNFFCMECANLIVEKPNLDRCCPVCHQKPTQAIRIFS